MILAALGLDISNFSSKLTEAGKKVSDFASKGGSVGGGIAAAFGVAAAGAAAAAAVVSAAAVGMYKAMSEGGALMDLTAQTGIGIDKLMALKVAFEQAGMSAEEVGPVINKLQKNIGDAAQGNVQAAAMFQKLGLSITDLQAMNPEEQLKAVGDAVAGITNPADKAAVAMEIFGKKGGKLLALFSGGMDEAAQAVGNQAQLMAQNAAIFDRITDILGTAAVKVQGFFVGMASAIAPQLLEAVDAFNAIDLSGVGQQIGSWVAVVLEAFNTGTLGELVQTSLIFAGESFVNFLYKGLTTALKTAAQLFIEEWKVLLSIDFWGALVTTLTGVLQLAVGSVLEKIPGMGKIGAEMIDRGGGNVVAGAGVIGEKVSTALGNVTEAGKAAWEGAQGPIETKQAADDMRVMLNNLREAAEQRTIAAQIKYQTEPGGGGGGGTVLAPMQKASQLITTSLAAIGGGFGGGTAANDPLLSEARQQNTNLSLIVDNTARLLNALAPQQQPTQLVLA